jgi:hypothetical protein
MNCYWYCVDTGAALKKENKLFWEIDSDGTKIPAATPAAGTDSTYEYGGCSNGGYTATTNVVHACRLFTSTVAEGV